MTTTTTDDPRIGAVDVDTWRAVPHPGNPAGSRGGAWCVVAGDYADEGEPDVLVEVTAAEHPEDVAKFIVEAVTNWYVQTNTAQAEIADLQSGAEADDAMITRLREENARLRAAARHPLTDNERAFQNGA